ncbi:unnamed protein product [Hermetia illucens]|uniref:BZIP domain-containing protein n=1 Tax=Hermetia illucens TaxID=343691 RepID=A0A7R8YYU8_HERIL|nr:unnamed protein product [Hermetia illucens]
MVDTKGVSSSISFSSTDPESSCDESVDVSYFEQLLNGEGMSIGKDGTEAVGTRSSSRLHEKRLETLTNDSKGVRSKSSSLEKLPTRRPDPNTSNRNALMARENRRKKKEYLTKLEEEVDEYKSENKKLRKILKQQFKMAEKLKHEKDYLRNVLANQTQITSLLNLFKNQSNASQSTASSPALSTTSSAQRDLLGSDFDFPDSFDESLLPKETDDFFKYIPDQNDLSLHNNLIGDHNYTSGNKSDAGMTTFESAIMFDRTLGANVKERVWLLSRLLEACTYMRREKRFSLRV